MESCHSEERERSEAIPIGRAIVGKRQDQRRTPRHLGQTDRALGIKVSLVETKQVDLPTEMQRAIARQAEAERERRAKVIHAEGEAQAAEKLAEAANIISLYPAAIHLRFLQTITKVAAEKNSTTILPLPIDLLTAFLQKKEKE